MDPALGWYGTYEIQLGYAAGARLLNYPDARRPGRLATRARGGRVTSQSFQ